MELPTLPLSFNLVFGEQDNSSQNLVNMEFFFESDEHKVKQMIADKHISNETAKDFCLFCDFYVEAGCEEKAVEYFKKGFDDEVKNDISPLQRIFRKRPKEQQVKLTVEPKQGFVRVFYHFLINGPLAHEVETIDQQIALAESNGLTPCFYASLDLKGRVSHNKKNRQNVKVNFVNFNLSSEKILSKQLIQSILALQLCDIQASEQFSSYFDLIRKLKKASIKLKFDSFRKISAFYSSLVKESSKSETKEFPYINQGIFRKKAEICGVFREKYASRMIINFQSEDVFIRLVKVYAITLGKALDISLYQ